MRDSIVLRFTSDAPVTSSPLNQFTLYRADVLTEKNILISFCDRSDDKIEYIDMNNAIQSLVRGEKKYIHWGCENSIIKFIKLITALNIILKKYDGDYLVHVHQPTIGAILAPIRYMGILSNSPWIYTIHSNFNFYSFKHKLLTLFASQSSDIITCISETSLQSLPRVILNMNKQLLMIPNGANTEVIDKVDSYQTSLPQERKFKLLYVGRLAQGKNIDMIIEACKNLKNPYKFIICGDGPERQYLETLAKQLSVYDNIDFRGMIKRVDVYHEMRNADLYISASSFEGMPVTALEAMYIGMPVLLSKIPAHEEVYKQNEIYNMFDISASNISHEINTIMSTYEKHGKYLGELNIEHVRSNYSLKSSQDRWTLLYDRLLNKKIKLQ